MFGGYTVGLRQFLLRHELSGFSEDPGKVSKVPVSLRYGVPASGSVILPPWSAEGYRPRLSLWGENRWCDAQSYPCSLMCIGCT